MPEDNQIQPGFQPEIQVNPQIQQNNLVQSQQTNQEVVQQNNVESAEQDLSQNSKPHKSWLNKFLGWIFIFLGLILNGFGIYAIYYQISDGYPIGDIITDSLVWPTLLVGICFIIIGIRNISGMKFLFWIKNLFLSQKTHSSWLVKIVSLLFLLLGIGLIGLGIYGIFETQSDWHYSDYTIRDIIMDSGFFFLGPIGILFISIGILSYRTEDVDVYYHPTRLTKILSGVYRFVGIALIRAGLWNLSLIGTEGLPFLKILYVGGIITLCGILYILLGRLLYSTKNKIHLGFSLLSALIVNIMFARILREFTDHSYGIDSYMFEFLGNIIVIFTLIYFSISTIRWIIKCRRFKRKGIINQKYLNLTPSKKKVGIIVTIILILLIIIDLIYGKIQWSKIPEVDESLLTREKHQIQLPDEEDALIQLKKLKDGNMYDIFYPLDSYYLHEQDGSHYSDNNKDISWKQHNNECIIITSGGNEYCGTWAWNEKTLDRALNNYYYIGDDYFKNLLDKDGYLSIDGKKVTIFEYIDKNEPEIKSNLQKLDEILSLDYYLDFFIPIDNPDYLLPQFLQGYTRANMVVLQYYTLKKDWNMVMFIIQLQYKMIDILNNFGGTISHLISFVIQNITDSTINQLVKTFPGDFRVQLSERYSNLDYNEEWMLKERIKGEYNNTRKNRAKDAIYNDIGSNKPSLMQFMFHFPFFSRKDSDRFMAYAYYNLMYDEQFDFNTTQLTLPKNSLYNYYGTYPYWAIRPRMQSYNVRLDISIYHKEALIKNLKSGEYDVRFSEKDWDSYEYENRRIPTDIKSADSKLIDSEVWEYSTIIQPCFGRNIIDPDYNVGIYHNEFKKLCTETLSTLKKQEDDDFGLKETLIEITELYLNYNEIEMKSDACSYEEGIIPDICVKIFNEETEIVNKIKQAYFKLSDILKNVKNEVLNVDLDEYFYIPYKKIYDKNSLLLISFFIDEEKSKELLNDIKLQESINTINKSEKELLSGNKNNEQIDYEKLVILTNICMGEDILRARVKLSYNDFINQCNYVMGELKNLDSNGNFKHLHKVLTHITKEWVEFANIGKEEDLLLEKEGTNVGGGSSEWDTLFNREDRNLENFKKYYTKLEEVMEEVTQHYGFTPEINFYIPYSVINENTFRFTLHL